MPLIQVELTAEEDEILRRAAAAQRRSKREQLAFSAIQHARALLEATSPLPRSAESAPKPEREEMGA